MRILLAAALLLPPAPRWGPHGPITQAAVDRLEPEHPLRAMLGRDIRLLRGSVMMADWALERRTDVGGEYYVDDYLRFPGTTRLMPHMPPEVRETYAPYFRRCVQALVTEEPLQAARWIGSLLHFVTDSGSPPHAAGISGELHSPMESLSDASRIVIPGYAPRLLGGDLEAAVDGLRARMDELMAYGKPRGEALRPLIAAGDRERAEPVILECALECSRVTADVLHTLGHVASRTIVRDGGRIEGVVRPAEGMPAKIVLPGTPYGTVAERDGRFVFRNLPAGRYTLSVLKPGRRPTRAEVVVTAGGTARPRIEMPASAVEANLIRNEDLSQRWVRPDAPDDFFAAEDAEMRGRHPRNAWKSEGFPIEAERTYRLSAVWKAGAKGEALVAWYPALGRGEATLTLSDPLPAGTGEIEVVAPPGMTAARVLLRVQGPPQDALARIALVLTN